MIKYVVILLASVTLASCALMEIGSRSKNATLVYMADLHGQFEEHPEMFWPHNGGDESEIKMAGGAARIYSAVRSIREENPQGTVFIDAGDTIQGSADVALTQGKAAIPILNSMGLDLAIPGNWEVVYGTKVFKDIAQKLNYPILASNILDQESNERVFPAYQVKVLNGLKVALIGFTDPDVPERQPPTFSKGFRYQSSELLQPLIDQIREDERPDAVVLITHIGLPKAVNLAGNLVNVDVVLSSDTHERTYKPITIGDTWVVEPGAFGSFLGRLDLSLDRTGRLQKRWQLIELTADSYSLDETVSSVVNETLRPLDRKMDQVIGETKVPLARYNVIETSLDALLADALKDATGTDIAFSNGFRFAYPVVPGPIYEKDLWSFYPITTQIKTGRISGQQILDFLEREMENVFSTHPEKLFGGWLPRVSGLKVRFDSSAPAFKRVKEVYVNGQPLESEKLYSVTSCVREGDPITTLCRIPNGRNIKIKDFDAHEAVRRYLKKYSPIAKVPHLNRMIADDLPQTVRSQYYRK